MLNSNKNNLLEKYGFKEVDIDSINNVKTGYPKSNKRFKIVYSSQQNTLENHYYFILNYIERILKYEEIEKITDVYTSSPMSSLFGNAMQKLGSQQDKASNIMAMIGRITLDLMKNIQELRKIDERLGYHKGFDQGSQAADIALKGVWADNVDSQSRTEASIIVMSQKTGFSALPDLFFRTYVKDESKIDEVVDNYDISNTLKSTLKRKLMNYLRWAKEVRHELKIRRKVLLRMIAHHYNTIKLYAYWLRPYLLNIKRLQMTQEYSDSAHLINSFDTNLSEIELMAKKKNGDKFSCLIIHFLFRTNPLMMTGKEYQKYPIHIGTLEITFRSYLWTAEEIENYKKMKDEETMKLVYDLNENIQTMLKGIGTDFEEYIKEAENLDKKEKQNDKKNKDINIVDDFGLNEIFEPFKLIFDGFKELLTLFFPKTEYKNTSEKKSPDPDKPIDDLTKLYIKYKKNNKFVTF